MSTKRKSTFTRVNLKGEKVEAKRKREDFIIEGAKELCTTLVLKCYIATILLMKVEDFDDIILSAYIFNVTFNAWNAVKQGWNLTSEGKKKAKALAAVDMTVDYHGKIYSCKAAELHKHIEDIIEYSRVDPPVGTVKDERFKTVAGYRGTLVTVFCLWNLYYVKFKGLKYSNTMIKMGKSEDGNEYMQMQCTEFGISNENVGLINGINWPPCMRSSLGSSMGCMAPALMLAKETTEKYKEKLFKLVKRNTSHLGSSGSEAIAKVLSKHEKSDLKEIISALSIILSITGGRNQERVAFPPAVILKKFIDKRSGWLDDAVKVPDEGGMSMEVEITMRTKLSRYLRGTEKSQLEVDFSGESAQQLYNWSTTQSFTMHQVEPVKAAQLHIHASFGYDLEDFGVLKKITELNEWNLRSEFGDEMKALNLNTAGTASKLNMIKMLMYSKQRSSTATKLLQGGSTMVRPIHVQSGFVVRNVTESMIRSLVEENHDGSVSESKNDVYAFLQGLKKRLKASLDGKRNYVEGTTGWYNMADLERPKGERNAIPNFAPTTEDVCYWSVMKENSQS